MKKGEALNRESGSAYITSGPSVWRQSPRPILRANQSAPFSRQTSLGNVNPAYIRSQKRQSLDNGSSGNTRRNTRFGFEIRRNPKPNPLNAKAFRRILNGENPDGDYFEVRPESPNWNPFAS